MASFKLTPLFSSEDIMEKQFCHMELQTGDVDKARDFYTGLFAWTVQGCPWAISPTRC